VIHRVNQVACAFSAQKPRVGASEWNTFSQARGDHMTGRRRHQRFLVSPLVTGVLEVLEDAVIESVDGTELVITTGSAPVVGDEATLHVEGETNMRSIRVRVVETQLHVVQAGVRHRVRLMCLDEESKLDAERLVLE
jgi:hypothetical protein